MSDEVREHVERPRPPWQTERKTECGRPIAEFAAVLSRDELEHKIKDQGIRRASLTTCYTCIETGHRHPDWDHSPTAVLERQCHGYWRTRTPLDDELRALAALWENHRDEYEAELTAIRAAVTLDELRRSREKRHYDRLLPPGIHPLGS